jgi:hypothetical protein
MLQKAMELKKRKNLEPMKGNFCAALQVENLVKLACDIKLHVGDDKSESKMIIDNLIDEEKQSYD